ncbi:Ff.00g065050.m01.CDS01 [Fusarium sp. VM40]|nr:Ff.00g065050.m01.CDS01 [Fusarium sp. VM40]
MRTHTVPLRQQQPRELTDVWKKKLRMLQRYATYLGELQSPTGDEAENLKILDNVMMVDIAKLAPLVETQNEEEAWLTTWTRLKSFRTFVHTHVKKNMDGWADAAKIVATTLRRLPRGAKSVNGEKVATIKTQQWNSSNDLNMPQPLFSNRQRASSSIPLTCDGCRSDGHEILDRPVTSCQLCFTPGHSSAGCPRWTRNTDGFDFGGNNAVCEPAEGTFTLPFRRSPASVAGETVMARNRIPGVSLFSEMGSEDDAGVDAMYASSAYIYTFLSLSNAGVAGSSGVPELNKTRALR